MFVASEQIFEDVGCRGCGHDDHGADGDALQGHGQTFVLAVVRHLLGLPAHIAGIIDGGHGHTGYPLEGHLRCGLNSLFFADHLA
jgi:hypothetical protein